MKKIIVMFLLIITSLINSQTQTHFSNPILAGFYPDPSLCKVGDDFYLVNSTFAYFPGIPVFHSKDLVNWKLSGHVLDRPEQLNLDGFGVSRAIFAPAIKYHDGIFYVTCTLVDGGGNFVVTAKNPAGPWSNPVWLPQVNGIDPSLFFDDDGKTYLLYNSDAPDNKPLYEGHRTIRMYEFDVENLKVVGDNIILVNGGVDLSKKPIWIEGPHIYKKDGYYYLLPAEGGTAEDHSQVAFRSKSVGGPYLPWDKNPILTQRHLDPNRKNPVTCTGHAAFVELDSGDWWAVFLACRPYEPFEENYYNTGRETFLAPVKWIDGWPVINPDFEEVQYLYPVPIQKLTHNVDIPYNGNFTLRDNFDESKLHPSWIFLRTPHKKWHNLNSQKGILSIDLRPETCSGKLNPSFIARRQQHSKGYGMTSFSFNPKEENEKAGLTIFQDETHFYYLCKSIDKSGKVIQLYKSTGDTLKNNMELIATNELSDDEAEKEILFKIEVDGKYFSFYYGFEQDNMNLVKDKVDATYLSIRKAWGFVGNVYALYATSLGRESSNSAEYSWFEYNGNDDIYNK